MLEAETVAFLESGCGLVVGTVDPAGAPGAGRAWGIIVVSGERGEIRLLVDRDDHTTVTNLASGASVAVTAADVRTYRAVQLKGRSQGTAPATAAEEARAARHIEEFYDGVQETDGTGWELFQRFLPSGYTVCAMVVEELYDQTPGPAAGSAIGRVGS